MKNPTPKQDDDWQALKNQNQHLNSELRNMDPNIASNVQDYPLPLNEDGSLSFYWIDAHEENNGADLYIFGKIF